MTLVVDNRAALGQAPALHVLIVGDSSYRHLPGGDGAPAPNDFGMQQLSSTALSAFRVYEWMAANQANFPVPLGTVRLLLAPSQAELDAEPALAASASSCTLGDFRTAASDWRADASADPGGMTVFYFAGHGVQRTKGDSVLLLQDFGDGVGGTLDKAVNTKNLQNGLAPSPSRPDIARTQLYFIDACRLMPDRFRDYEQMETASVWDVELAGVDDRRAPMYFASVPGTVAYARRAKQTLFSEALLDCLNGGAAELRDEGDEERWVVTHLSLAERLSDYVYELAAESDAEQLIRSDGFGADAVVCYLDAPPTVKIELEIDPPDALAFTQIGILNDAGAPATQVPKPLAPYPYSTDLPAGIYTIRAEIEPANAAYVALPGRARPLRPPRVKRVLRVTP
jgi:Caspase domain